MAEQDGGALETGGRERDSGDGESKVVDEPVSPAGRFFLQPGMDQVINCIFGFENPIDIQAIKTEFHRTLVHFHPRFRSLLVRDNKGREYWRPSPDIDIDKHIFAVSNDDEISVNDYVAELTVSSPLSMDKPLWEFRVLPHHRCGVLRLNHALGDGIAIISLFLASCERADDPSLPMTVPGDRRREKKRTSFSPTGLLWRAIKVAFFTVLFVADFLLHAAWKKDKANPISGGAGVELWPRKLCTLTFELDDIKTIKTKINGTINDVLVGIIASGLAKYFKMKSDKESRKHICITGLSMVNIRGALGLQDFFTKVKEGTAKWGNRFGYVLMPIWLHKSIGDPFEYAYQAKAILGKKKQSLEAHFSYYGGSLIMSTFGIKVASQLNYRITCNTTFTLTNVVGPRDKAMFAKNPITHMRNTSSSLPHALTIHMISYNGKADMQLLVAKDIIQDLEALVKCFEDAFKEMMYFSTNKN